MKKILLIILFSLNAQAETKFELGAYLSPHLWNDKSFNHIGDERTTLNPAFRIHQGKFSYFVFQDSIGLPAYGISYKALEWGNFSLEVGTYKIDEKKWDSLKFEKFWFNGGLVPIVAPAYTIKINNHLKFHTFGNWGYISTGLVFEF